jgi:hypothetical protein
MVATMAAPTPEETPLHRHRRRYCEHCQTVTEQTHLIDDREWFCTWCCRESATTPQERNAEKRVDR